MTNVTRWQLARHFLHEQERMLREDSREPNGVDWVTLRNFIRDLEQAP